MLLGASIAVANLSDITAVSTPPIYRCDVHIRLHVYVYYMHYMYYIYMYYMYYMYMCMYMYMYMCYNCIAYSVTSIHTRAL